MQVFVKTVSGKLITVEVESSESIEYMKIKMQEGKKQPEAEVEAEAEAEAEEEEDCFQINVKSITGNTIPFEVRSSDTVYSLKAKIHVREGVWPECQRLLLSGKQLEEGRTLADCNIQNDSILHLLLHRGRKCRKC